MKNEPFYCYYFLEHFYTNTASSRPDKNKNTYEKIQIPKSLVSTFIYMHNKTGVNTSGEKEFMF